MSIINFLTASNKRNLESPSLPASVANPPLSHLVPLPLRPSATSLAKRAKINVEKPVASDEEESPLLKWEKLSTYKPRAFYDHTKAYRKQFLHWLDRLQLRTESPRTHLGLEDELLLTLYLALGKSPEELASHYGFSDPKAVLIVARLVRLTLATPPTDRPSLSILLAPPPLIRKKTENVSATETFNIDNETIEKLLDLIDKKPGIKLYEIVKFFNITGNQPQTRRLQHCLQKLSQDGQIYFFDWKKSITKGGWYLSSHPKPSEKR